MPSEKADRQRQETLPLLTSGRCSAQVWLDWIDQIDNVNILLTVARSLQARKDSVLPPPDDGRKRTIYTREQLISYALKKVLIRAVDSRMTLLRRFIPFEAYDIKLEVIDSIINEPLDNKEDRTVTDLLRLGEFLTSNPQYLPADLQMQKLGKIFKRLQALEGVAAVSGEIRGNVERVT